jgi:hypothetical protein
MFVWWIDTILRKEQSRIHDKHPIMLLKHHNRWESLNLPRNLKMKNLTPTSNLTWLRDAVRKCDSGANVAGMWPGSNYKSYRILYHISNGYLHALIRSMVWELWLFGVDRAAEILFWKESGIPRNLTFHSKSNAISANLQYQRCSLLPQFPGGYLYALFR